MADGGERRMLFDIRGRRRHVVRVVYAVLALLMGTSLFLVVGPFNLGEIVGGGGAKSASEALEEQAGRIEGRLQAKPEDENLLLALTRARINAGNALTETNPQTGGRIYTPQALAQFQQGVSAWNRYLEQAKPPNPAAATFVAGTYFSLAETSRSFGEINAYVNSAAEAATLAAKGRPSVGAFTTLAIYEYFNGNFDVGDRALRQAQDLVRTKAEEKAVARQLAPYRQRAKQYQKQGEKLEKAQPGQGKEAFESAIGGLGGAGLSSSLGQ